mmetsp:Transcript_125319/g.390151  ORF Transcript_125319/g.390151 Transcript_125319/m.390151 type:complete len:226 (-) Transcript_125319:49-726(-)
MPSQVFISATPKVLEFLEECSAKGAAKRHKDAGSIELDELYRLVDDHERGGGPPVKIHELLEGAEVTERREARAEPLSELERMRVESEERRYQHLVRDVAPLTKLKRQEPGEHQQGLRFATNFATQVVVAFIGAFLLGYFFVETFVAPDSFNAKVIAGAFCSFFTLLLETFLLVVHEQKKEMLEQRARTQQDRQKKRDARAPSARQPASAEAEAEPKPAREKKED